MIDLRRRLNLPSGTTRTYYSLPMLEKAGMIWACCPVSSRRGLGPEELGLDGSERSALAVNGLLRPGVSATLNIERQDGRRDSVPLVVRIDTPIDAAYFSAGGILPYVPEQLIADTREAVP